MHALRPMMPRIPRRGRLRGFTLVELMVVVVIVGILGSIGISAFRKQVYGSKSSEALAMIQSIRAAEERWRAENLRYLNVSPDATTYYPSLPRGDGAKRNFYRVGTCVTPNPTPSEDCLWKLLSPAVPGPVAFGYNVTAGPPSSPTATVHMTVPQMGASLPEPQDHWYVIQAAADADHDGIYARYASTSLKADIASQNEGE